MHKYTMLYITYDSLTEASMSLQFVYRLSLINWFVFICIFLKFRSSISIQDAADNDDKTSPILSNSTSDLHLKSCLEDNNNNNNTSSIKGIKNETENTSESNIIINGENQEISSNTNRPTDVSIWSVDHVQQWLLEEGFPREAEAFYQQEIDGTCLLLMKRMDVLTELGIKLGPAVKIYERIKRFQSQCGSPT